MSEEYRHIVRVSGKDIDGQENLLQGLTKVSGVGLRLSKAIIIKLGMDPSARLGHNLRPGEGGYASLVYQSAKRQNERQDASSYRLRS